MSNDGLFKISKASLGGPGFSAGVRAGPIGRARASIVAGPQDTLPSSASLTDQASGVRSTQRAVRWDDLLDRNTLASIDKNLRTLIAGTRDPQELPEWSRLDRSFLAQLRQSSAISLKRVVGELFYENHPLIPDVINAACCLFEDGMLSNVRLNRMLAAEIIVSATHLLYVGFQPVYAAASTLRKFIEAQALLYKESEQFVIEETIFSEVAKTKPRPAMITPKLRNIVMERAMHRAEEHAEAKKNETLFCMRAYENLIPRFAKGHTEVTAGMKMCSAMIDGAWDNEVIWKAYELQGQLIDLQPPTGTPAF